MCGSGAVSAAGGRAAASATDSDFAGALLVLEDEAPVQATVTPNSMASGRAKQILNHRGTPRRHTEARGWTVEIWVSVACSFIPGDPSVSPVVFGVSLCPLWLRFFCGALITLVGMHHPRDTRAQDIQSDHGRGKDAHIQDVRSRRNDGRNDKDAKNGVANISPHPPGANNPHERQ